MTMQNDFLDAIKAQQGEIAVFTTNGVRLVGFLTDFDQYALILASQEYGKQMIYKHAISTVQPVTE